MNERITTFINSLDLPSSRAQYLTLKLGHDSTLEAFLNGKERDASALLQLACFSAEICLGADSVDSSPVNHTEVDGNWSEACWQSPSCAVIPSTTENVSKVFKIIKFFQTKFAIRSGGHSPNPGWSSIDKSGLLIDLRKLNQVKVSDDRKIASLGPGGRWGDVFAALDPYGVSVIGGRIPHVGVGGLILGGGYFHFSGQYGLAADNVQNFEVVLADGSVVNANQQQNTDLFWALKGGGSNFGVVTRFDLYTIPVQGIWYQVTIHAKDQVPSILEAFAEWQEKGGASDVKSTVALIVGLETTTLGLIYSEHTEKPAAFEPFYSITPATIAVPPTNGTVLTITQILGTTFSNAPMRHDYRGAASKIDAQLYKDVYKFWREQAVATHEATGANMTFVLQPVPKNLVDQGVAKGGNPLGLPRVNHQWWTTLVDWQNASDDTRVRAAPIAVTEKWRELGEQRGLNVPFLFMNDGSRDQSPLSLYGVENLAKLKGVSKKYDPSQMMQRLQNGGFLLAKV